MPGMNELLGSNPAATALSSRGLSPALLMQQSPMSQVTPSSPNFDPSMQAPQAPAMPDRSPMTGMAPMPPAQPMGPGAPTQPMQQPQQPAMAPKFSPADEAELITHTLTKRLLALNKKAEEAGKTDQQDHQIFSNGVQDVAQQFKNILYGQ